MKRRQLVELEDLPWFPAVLRDGGTAFLELAARGTGRAHHLAGPLERALAHTGATRIVDLCSGGGGCVRVVAAEVARRGHDVDVVLTDLYPNPRAYAHAALASGGRVTGHADPVDATDVPDHLDGFRTLFNAFHHFPPDVARRVLADAVAARQPIGVFELVGRDPLVLLAILGLPAWVTLSLPFWRPFRWAWVPLTWGLPLIQGFVLWDGLVSWLRVYSEDELRELVAGIDAPDWAWDIGTVRLGRAPAYATYLVGRPLPPPEG